MPQDSGNNAYIGLTIGPIIKTLLTAKRTRHLWGASYSFAYIMKEIAKAFDDKNPGREWLKPALGKAARQTFTDPKNRTESILHTSGVGIFPDHLIVESTDIEDVTDLDIITKKVIEDFGGNVAKKLGSKVPEKIKAYLLDYFQVHIIRENIDTNENPILRISNLLSAVELQPSFPAEKREYLFEFFDKVGTSFLTEDAFASSKSFLSIPEIALSTHLVNSVRTNTDGKDCRKYIDDKLSAAKVAASTDSSIADEQYVDWVKEFIAELNQEEGAHPIDFFTGQKYIAIVQADGDSIGRLLKSLPKASLGKFSEKLTDFALAAASLVTAYDGMPVYFGGDDALFFAPVVHGDHHIFNLLCALDESFRKHFEGFGIQSTPTLSFGLSITYYKYPLYEALEQSGRLLREVAKEGIAIDKIDPKTGEKERVKNNIAFQVLRHSGSAFSGLIHLDKKAAWSILDTFTELFKNHIRNPRESLRSILYMIPANKALLNIIAKDRVALGNFIDQSFDEDIHHGSTEYLSKVADLIHAVYIHSHRFPSKAAPEGFSSPDQMAYNLLKTIAFLTTLEK